jgi:hypothetical protein
MLVVLAIAILLLVTFIGLFLKRASRLDRREASPAWLEEFSLETYAPMERLLDASDFRFLAAQPGFQPEMSKRLLSERRRIFGQYLSMLIRDFNQLHFLARLMLVHSEQDRPELASELFRQRIRFYFAVSLVRCKVALYPLGWTAVDVPKLLHALERMRAQIALGTFPPATDAI